MDDKLARRLNGHQVFKNLQGKLPPKRSKFLNLICSNNEIIYLWNEKEKSIETVDIKSLETNEHLDLLPNPAIFFNVEKIMLNESSTMLALFGTGGLAVVRIPDRWLLKEKKVEVPCTVLGQRLFLAEKQTLREVRWYPASPTDSHLLLLTSDACLRLYNTIDESLVWTWRLSNNVLRQIPNMVSIGETPVDFDFSLPEGEMWPVYVLWGNGDVYCVQTSLDGNRITSEGPFSMQPPAEDNYGTDASAIAVLNSEPTIIVYSTCSGSLFHCLLLGESDEPRSLHVIERIDLELGISLGADDDIVSCPIRIEKHPHEPSHYFCLHNAGIHSISFPIVSLLKEFADNEETVFSYNQESFVEYLLCTGVTSNNEFFFDPALGIAFPGAMKLLVILPEGKLIAMSSFHSSAQSDVLNLEEPVIEPFVLEIQDILKEGVSTCPILKLPAGGAAHPKDWQEITSQRVAALSAVIKTHYNVALKIQERVQYLRCSVAKQRSDLDKLSALRSSLRSTAEQIAEKYEEINDGIAPLLSRVDNLIRTDPSRPSLTIAESKMTEHLEKAKMRLSHLQTEIDSVKSQMTQLDVSKPDKEININPIVYTHLQSLKSETSNLVSRVKAAQVLANRLPLV